MNDRIVWARSSCLPCGRPEPVGRSGETFRRPRRPQVLLVHGLACDASRGPADRREEPQSRPGHAHHRGNPGRSARLRRRRAGCMVFHRAAFYLSSPRGGRHFGRWRMVARLLLCRSSTSGAGNHTAHHRRSRRTCKVERCFRHRSLPGGSRLAELSIHGLCPRLRARRLERGRSRWCAQACVPDFGSAVRKSTEATSSCPISCPAHRSPRQARAMRERGPARKNLTGLQPDQAE